MKHVKLFDERVIVSDPATVTLATAKVNEDTFHNFDVAVDRAGYVFAKLAFEGTSIRAVTKVSGPDVFNEETGKIISRIKARAKANKKVVAAVKDTRAYLNKAMAILDAVEAECTASDEELALKLKEVM